MLCIRTKFAHTVVSRSAAGSGSGAPRKPRLGRAYDHLPLGEQVDGAPVTGHPVRSHERGVLDPVEAGARSVGDALRPMRMCRRPQPSAVGVANEHFELRPRVLGLVHRPAGGEHAAGGHYLDDVDTAAGALPRRGGERRRAIGLAPEEPAVPAGAGHRRTGYPQLRAANRSRPQLLAEAQRQVPARGRGVGGEGRQPVGEWVSGGRDVEDGAACGVAAQHDRAAIRPATGSHPRAARTRRIKALRGRGVSSRRSGRAPGPPPPRC